MARVVVLGAGPAGCAAARRCAHDGHEVVLVERAAHVGGMATSIEVAGMAVDAGSHRLHPAAPPAMLHDLRSLLGDDLQERRRHGRLRIADRWVAFPLQALDLLRALPPRLAARAALDALAGPLRRQSDASFGAALRAGLGPAVTGALYEPYARKLWGVDADELDADLARRRVRASSPTAIVGRLWKGRQADGPTFLYPVGGFGRIAEALAADAVVAGATVLLDHEVVAVRAGAPAEVQVRDSAGAVRTLHADAVLSTLPMPVLAAATTPGPPPPVAEALSSLSWRGMLIVHLVLAQPWWTPYDAHYLPGPDTPISRISEPKRYRDDPADPAERTVVTLEVPVAVGDDRWRRADDALVTELVSSLAGAGLPALRPVDAVVRRLPRVYPIHRRGWEAAMAPVEAWAASLDGVLVLGRQGLFVPDNTHHVLQMGEDAADVVGADGAIDRASWSAARDRFRGHVVED